MTAIVPNNKLTKEERLHSKKLIDKLFKEGKSLFSYPFKVIYISVNEESVYPSKLLISVSKRHFKKAVDRNYLKRLVREAYRNNKEPLVSYLKTYNKSLFFGLIYVSETILSYREIERKLILILQRLIEQDEDHIR
ncbi:MAG: ribonuclease P protein component [Bacteroidetes bacterium]|nr:ribonuclease P protein component [Bacteroidota bacterium]